MTVEPAVPRLRHQVPLLAWLVVVWILLWGTWSWANLLSGLAIALVVMLLLPLPPVVGSTRVRPLPLIRFVGHFLGDVVVSGAQVAWRALGPGGVGQGAIVRVQLRADSDLLLTVVAETISLVPGSLVLDLDREHRLISVHLLHATRADRPPGHLRAGDHEVDEEVPDEADQRQRPDARATDDGGQRQQQRDGQRDGDAGQQVGPRPGAPQQDPDDDQPDQQGQLMAQPRPGRSDAHSPSSAGTGPSKTDSMYGVRSRRSRAARSV